MVKFSWVLAREQDGERKLYEHWMQLGFPPILNDSLPRHNNFTSVFNFFIKKHGSSYNSCLSLLLLLGYAPLKPLVFSLLFRPVNVIQIF